MLPLPPVPLPPPLPMPLPLPPVPPFLPLRPAEFEVDEPDVVPPVIDPEPVEPELIEPFDVPLRRRVERDLVDRLVLLVVPVADEALLLEGLAVDVLCAAARPLHPSPTAQAAANVMDLKFMSSPG